MTKTGEIPVATVAGFMGASVPFVPIVYCETESSLKFVA